MTRWISWVGILVLVATTVTWIGLGSHRGWTQTQIPEQSIDPITEIEFTEYREGFLPGVDFLVAGVAVGGLLMGVGSFFAWRKKRARGGVQATS
jgi:hypothetical protein